MAILFYVKLYAYGKLLHHIDVQVKDQLIIHSSTQAIFYDEHLVTLITRLFVENARKLMNGKKLNPSVLI